MTHQHIANTHKTAHASGCKSAGSAWCFETMPVVARQHSATLQPAANPNRSKSSSPTLHVPEPQCLPCLSADQRHQHVWHAILRRYCKALRNDHETCSMTQAAKEAEYLQIQSCHVCEPLFNCFMSHGLIPTMDRLWERKSIDLVRLPDALLLSHLQETVEFWRNEIVYMFQPHVQADKVLFKQLPVGNHRPIIYLSDGHLIIDISLLGIDNVHELLRRDASLDCQLQPGTATGCNCSRELLLQLTLDALSALPGFKKDTLHRQVFKRYMTVTAGKVQNLPATGLTPAVSPKSTSAVSPSPSRPASASHAGQVAVGMSAIHAAGASSRRPPSSRPSSGHQHSSYVFPLISEKDLQRDIDSMLKGTAQQRLEHVRAAGSQVTEPIFPQEQQEMRDVSTLQKTSICLDRSMQHSKAQLYLPIDAQGRQLIASSSVPVSQIQGLYALLVELHKLFSARRQEVQQPFQVYWEVDTDIIAFNADGSLWYNAAKDGAVQDTTARSRFWYLVSAPGQSKNKSAKGGKTLPPYISRVWCQGSCYLGCKDVNW